MSKLYLILLAILPSFVKIRLLNARGHKIDKSCRIGICYLDIKLIEMKKGSKISSLNFFKGLQSLKMGEYARIGGNFNWFTASHLHKLGQEGYGEVIIGMGSNITSKHFFDVQQRIQIGEQSLIAGFRSTFWTHGYRDTANSQNNGITIGSNCYIGSQVIFLQGTSIGNNNFVGAGSVVTRNYANATYELIAGNPAKRVKSLEKDLDFFNRSQTGFLPIKHKA